MEETESQPFEIKRKQRRSGKKRRSRKKKPKQKTLTQKFLLQIPSITLGLFLGWLLFSTNSISSNFKPSVVQEGVTGVYSGKNKDHTSVADYDAIKCGHDASCSCETQYPQTLTNMMRTDQKELLARYVTDKHSYFEWGSGGSTDTFPRLLAPGALTVSVENYMPWCQKLKVLPYLQCKMAKQELRFSCHDPGVVLKTSGNIVQHKDIGTYTAYIDAIRGTWWRPKSNDGSNPDKYLIFHTFDVILVDGRSRVACALNALEYMNEKSVVIMHDWQRYFDNALLLKYFHVIDASKPILVEVTASPTAKPQIAVLKKKRGVTKASEEDMMVVRRNSH